MGSGFQNFVLYYNENSFHNIKMIRKYAQNHMRKIITLFQNAELIVSNDL